ncbi:MAG: MTH938/NDUFAF3 family protein [Mariprofundaceae bacterium]
MRASAGMQQLPGDITPRLPADSLLFRAYGDDYLQIGDSSYAGSLLIHDNTIVHPWQPQRLKDLTLDHLEPVFASPPEVLLIGSGRKTAFPTMAVLDALTAAHIGFECMASQACARTFNLLVMEGRQVSTAIMPPASRP